MVWVLGHRLGNDTREIGRHTSRRVDCGSWARNDGLHDVEEDACIKRKLPTHAPAAGVGRGNHTRHRQTRQQTHAPCSDALKQRRKQTETPTPLHRIPQHPLPHAPEHEHPYSPQVRSVVRQAARHLRMLRTLSCTCNNLHAQSGNHNNPRSRISQLSTKGAQPAKLNPPTKHTHYQHPTCSGDMY